MTLHSYFGRKFLYYFVCVFFIFFLFCTTAELANQLRWHSSLTDFKTLLYLALLRTPETIYAIMPLIMIFSAIWLFLALARSSELVVARGAGRSGISFLYGPICVAIFLGGFLLTVFNPIVAVTSGRYIDASESIKSEGSSVFSIGSEGLWLRQGDPNGYTVIRASNANATGTTLYNVSFFTYSLDGSPAQRIEAQSATLKIGEWELINLKTWSLSKEFNPEANVISLLRDSVPTDLTLEQIRDRFEKPSSVPIWSLPTTISQLETAGFSAKRHQVWLQAEISRPFFLLAMLVLGAAFSMRHTRLGGTGIAILIAVILGFGLFYLRNVAQILGENSQLPTFIAVWTPPAATMLLGISIMLHMEDG